MKMREKTVKRYCVFAKRKNENTWTDWTQLNDLNKAMEQVAKVRELGFLGRVTDRKRKRIKILTSD